MFYLGRPNVITRVLKSGCGKKKNNQFQSTNTEERKTTLAISDLENGMELWIKE